MVDQFAWSLSQGAPRTCRCIKASSHMGSTNSTGVPGGWVLVGASGLMNRCSVRALLFSQEVRGRDRPSPGLGCDGVDQLPAGKGVAPPVRGGPEGPGPGAVRAARRPRRRGRGGTGRRRPTGSAAAAPTPIVPFSRRPHASARTNRAAPTAVAAAVHARAMSPAATTSSCEAAPATQI